MGQQLEALLQHCTVKLTISGQRGWGTGFFVAPGKILTCFHVVKNAENGQVNVHWQQQENFTLAVIEEYYEALDLALLTFEVATTDLPCVYLDEAFQADDHFYIYGYPDNFPQGASVTAQCEGIAFDQQSLIKFKAGQVRPGLSGSPILNQRTGKVCGMVKFTRSRTVDLGGGGITCENIVSEFPYLIEEQASFHQQNRQWSSLLPKSEGYSQLTRQGYRNRQTLLNKVHHYWIKGVLETSLYHHAAIELGLEERPEALSSLSNLVVEFPEDPTTQSSQNVRAIDWFDQLGTGRTLLILGEPGSGKTITLLQMARDLIKRAQEDVHHLIPVVFNLSSWVDKNQSIAAWLAKELHLKYQIPENIGQAWVQKERLLLLLDGLDELVTPELQEACIEALNQFHRDFCSPEMVVCSREQDYLALSNRLNLESAIYLRSLTLEQINNYLESAGDALAALRTLMKSDPILQELAKSPLMLNMMAIVYQGVGRDELRKTDLIEEQRTHLFNAYIQRMFKHRPQSRSNYSPTQTMQWLTWLASRLAQFSQSVLLIETMQPTWFSGQRQRQVYRVAVRFLLLVIWGMVHLGLLAFHHSLASVNRLHYSPLEGLIHGLIGGLLGALLYGVVRGLIHPFLKRFAKLINGLLLGTIYGLIFGIIWQDWTVGIGYGLSYGLVGIIIDQPLSKPIEPIETFQWSWKKARIYVGLGLIIALSLHFGGTTGGDLQSFIFGMMACLIFFFTKGDNVSEKTMANQGIWKSAANAGQLFLTIGLLTTVLLTWVEDLISGLVNGVILGLLAALLGAQFSGIVCLQHFVLRLILWYEGNIPWNYASFLDYAVDRIFLQKVGGGYIFIHRRLRDHFAHLRDNFNHVIN